MNCPHCNHENPDRARFCVECGAAFIKRCTSCQAELPPKAKFCLECGAAQESAQKALPDNAVLGAPPAEFITTSVKASIEPTPLEGERRQLTVMFCDMVGFTALASSIDPEILQGIVRQYEDVCAACVARYEGYVFQRLGDGVVAFFGYPLAHEGEAERAIHAGLAILDSLLALEVPVANRLQVRIGIASGLVVVASIAQGAVGEPMNLAARLQNQAQHGQLVISDAVRRLVGGAFEYEDLGERSLKGIAQPQRVFRVLGRSQVSRFEAATRTGVTPLVGREHELALLLDRWQLAQENEGQVALLSGEPGIGKSRILATLIERLKGQPHSVLRLQCSPYHVNSAFYPIIESLERTLNFPRDDTSEVKLEKLEAYLGAHFDLPRTDIRLIAEMLTIPTNTRYGALELTPRKQKEETQRTMVDMVSATAKRQPTVLLFEDLHWADPTSLEALDQIIEGSRNIALLIVLTFRPEFQSRWSHQSHVTGLNLSRLTRAQSTAIVMKLAQDRALSTEMLAQILAKTDGVPLYVEELTKSVLEAGATMAHGIPASLHDSLMARLDRLPSAKEVAQIGAAIGREFSYALLAAVAQRPVAALNDALTQLVDSGLVFRRGNDDDATYMFKHALVQDAAYDSLLKSTRQIFHLRIARALETHFPRSAELEPELLARHFTEAGEHSDAVTYWQRAGELAAQRSAGSDALTHLNTGLSLLVHLPSDTATKRHELSMQILLGRVLMGEKGWASEELERAYLRAQALCEECGSATELFSVQWGLWTNYLVSGALHDAMMLANNLIVFADQRNEPLLRAGAYYSAGTTQYWLGEWRAARQNLEVCIEESGPLNHEDLINFYGLDIKSTSTGLAGNVDSIIGNYSEVMLERVSEFAEDPNFRHPYSLMWVSMSKALTYAFQNDSTRLPGAAKHAKEYSDNLGFVQESAMARALEEWAKFLKDAGDGSISAFESAVSAWYATGARTVKTWYESAHASMQIARGELASAKLELEAAINDLAQSPEQAFASELHRLLGDVLSKLEESPPTNGAETQYLQALAIARQQGALTLELRAAISLAKLHGQQARRNEAYELLRGILGQFPDEAVTQELTAARKLLREAI